MAGEISQCISALTLLVGSFDPDMTCNVFGGT